jgi:hypothetical protein
MIDWTGPGQVQQVLEMLEWASCGVAPKTVCYGRAALGKGSCILAEGKKVVRKMAAGATRHVKFEEEKKKKNT